LSSSIPSSSSTPSLFPSQTQSLTGAGGIGPTGATQQDEFLKEAGINLVKWFKKTHKQAQKVVHNVSTLQKAGGSLDRLEDLFLGTTDADSSESEEQEIEEPDESVVTRRHWVPEAGSGAGVCAESACRKVLSGGLRMGSLVVGL
jgi:hypothetical protein